MNPFRLGWTLVIRFSVATGGAASGSGTGGSETRQKRFNGETNLDDSQNLLSGRLDQIPPCIVHPES
jgi:hypothetical protein